MRVNIYVASQWSVDVRRLSQCGSSFEVAVCLRSFEETLDGIDAADRIKYCKADFENCIHLLREKGVVFSSDLTRAIIRIMKRYFDTVRYIHCLSSAPSCINSATCKSFLKMRFRKYYHGFRFTSSVMLRQ